MDATKIDLTQNYILPLRIKDASGQRISGNLGVILLNIGVKNLYDATYHVTGTLTRQGLPPDVLSEDIPISTINGTTSKTYVGYFGVPSRSFDIVVNPDNSVTIKAEPSSDIVVIPIPGKPSSYDPVAKTFILNYMYTNGSGKTRIFNEVRTRN